MKKQIKKFGSIILLALIASLMFSGVADAVYQIPQEFMPENNPLNIIGDSNDKDAGTYVFLVVLQIIAGSLLYFAAPLAVLSIALIGFDLALNSGNPEKVETQKKRLTWVILGLLTIILSYGLVRIAIGFLGELFGAGTGA
ncbi:hypothetical protein HOG17_01530 [Candidatus Peregrinibacteria bacterium]|jgi:hypothetical protein|nr:hypothetical protein [Candidatus Peregrinibacteria bacterium]MBT4148414.1 hypothetical protein [Candidatus Peregrinibacteria bacterium]MBT4366473.1 hypothetical protein [Candidatus Peregrinibacteria bacterium]MBT4456076.1 hypothetical protein [Candidatus Peregrinibacteria bacterium]